MSIPAPPSSSPWIAAVEGGGTSFVVAVANREGSILHQTEIDSSHDQPHRTLQECASFFEQHKPADGYAALGVATFGPVGLRIGEETYGHILSSSPKAPWRNVDFLTPLVTACRGSRPLAVKIDTDVNAPAMAEYVQETKKNTISSLAYVTVGTGIGVGLVIHGQPVHGRMHPEGGHVPIQPLQGDPFEGYSWGDKSPFQGKRTVESMTCSVALTERLEQMQNQKNLSRDCLAQLDDDNEIWDHAANALANLCVTLLLTVSIEKIVLGGGIMKRKGLIEKVRKQTVSLMNGYLELPEDMSEIISLSSFGSNVGLVGALVLGQQALAEKDTSTESTSTQMIKRSAYQAGLWHGMLIGLSAVYVGFCLFARQKGNRR
jgi:fructokinase